MWHRSQSSPFLHGGFIGSAKWRLCTLQTLHLLGLDARWLFDPMLYQEAVRGRAPNCMKCYPRCGFSCLLRFAPPHPLHPSTKASFKAEQSPQTYGIATDCCDMLTNTHTILLHGHPTLELEASVLTNHLARAVDDIITAATEHMVIKSPLKTECTILPLHLLGLRSPCHCPCSQPPGPKSRVSQCYTL